MTVRDFIIYIAGSNDIETDLGELAPQTVLVRTGENEFHELLSIWVRGDNKLILDLIEGGDE